MVQKLDNLQTEALRLGVYHSSEAGGARRSAKELSAAAGFAGKVCDEIGIAVSELASNLLRHAGGGRITMSIVKNNGTVGFHVEAEDDGPGIANINQVLADGFSTAGGPGLGLGSINRLMDEFEVFSQPKHGTKVVCCRWLRKHKDSVRLSPLEIGVATRALAGGNCNGDDFVIRRWDESLLVGVIDGLGHGAAASQAAKAARFYVENHYDLPLLGIFRGVGIACRGTRGCVMALARFDWGAGRVTFGSVGNIETRVIGVSAPLNFMVHRGIIGVNAPDPHVTEHSWSIDDILLIFTDGIITHWSWGDFQDLESLPAQQVAQKLLRSLARENDDATIMVIKKVADVH